MKSLTSQIQSNFCLGGGGRPAVTAHFEPSIPTQFLLKHRKTLEPPYNFSEPYQSDIAIAE